MIRSKLACTVAAALAAVVAPRAHAAPGAHAAPPAPHTADVNAAADAHGAARAPVVITVVVDQLAGWIADERWPTLPRTGGFARLTREGTRATLWYAHAVTDTAPGHAALYTGAPPRGSGIFGNEILDEESHHRVSILRDRATRLVAVDGPQPLAGASLAMCKLPTLADALRAAHPDATIVSLSLKDRGALFGGGRAPTASLWFDAALGGFVTSTAIAPSLPPWARPIVAPEPLRAALTWPWTLLDRPFVAAHAATPDAQPGEGDLDGLGVSFPHLLALSTSPPHAWRATPSADATLLALALAAVDARRPGAPMLLALSLSANDYVGHVYGPDSWEAWDELDRLDDALGRFFAALDARLGPDGWALVLSADHGVATLPEAAAIARPWCARATLDRWHRPCGDAGRVLPDALADGLRAAARRALGPGDWIDGVADPYVYVSATARALPPARRRRLDEALAAALRAWPGVAALYDAQHPPARCPAADTVDARVCRALVPGAPGEFYVVLRPGWFFDPDYVVGFGASHGSPYDYDRAVPLVVRAPGRAPAGRVVAAPVAPDAFSATAADLLGIAPPPAARRGRDLAR